MLKERFKEIEVLLLAELLSYYKERIISVVLFGSAGRGTPRYDSDIDILLIASELPDGRMKRVREFDIVEDNMSHILNTLHKDGITTYISPIIKSPEEVKMGSPLFLDMVNDAKILFDRDHFFTAILMRLKDHLNELGSKRIWRGDAWFWDLKPNYKSGDVIEI